MSLPNPQRRRFIVSGVSVALAAGIAGCLGDDDDGNGNGDGNGTDPEDEAIDWAEPAANWEGEITDWTGETSVTVENGQLPGSAQFVFDPPVIRIDTGTTVTWVWIDDQNHSVTDDDGAFDSGDIQGEGETFEHTFDESGVYLYYCRPHLAQNQRGAVIVE